MELYKLVKLQKIDTRLMELEAMKGNLPEQVEELRERLAKLQADLVRTRTELEETKKQSRNADLELRTLTDKLKKHQDQLYSVKTNKEYDAITVEIENFEKQIEVTELRGVELLEKVDRLAKEVTGLEQQVAEFSRALNEREQELQHRLAETNAEHEQLMARRDALVSNLDRRLFASYERIRKGRNGTALAEVVNYTCSACYATIPAQTVVEVRKMDRIINCEVCGRILVITNERLEKRLSIDAESAV
ncbi:MAG: C4-type zinc ribbon domain-containing protein [candidate division KSB1 bacterium]|nr:C4-type zinc ribbon domain-containing protein [candidate division KSB1 bacterium]MDZ7334153.1 C4-type zinc ribbon domain-containing protein [candidate division KSB1 bacterium]MDZ7357401.1 C4-type zinc ribbon domain-containing protein [candidate division KSB1 bacterium]MDZ7377143.1 C4-type zinc ribbon domain-containing protein [candidate division KSB1 bacterium]MDZ7401351.1 C4-type zinc ribbon domain-containing protein [candidate division KSB1 bacterium]